MIREVAEKSPQQIEYQIQALESMSYLAYSGISSGSKNAELVTKLLAEMEIKIKHLLDNFQPTYKRQIAIAFACNVKAAYKNVKQKPEEAVELYRMAIDLLKTIKDQDAPDARSADQFLQTWAICHLNYGISGSSSGEMISEQNLKDIDEGLEYSRLLLQCHPKAYVFRMQLMQALRVKGAALAKLERTAESTEVIEESNQVLEELMKDNPKQPWVLSMRAMQNSMELVERIRKGELGDFETELLQIQEAANPANQADILYNSVCAYSQAIPHESAKKEEYLGKIKELLGQLQKLGGLSDLRQQEHMKVDADLDPIRSDIDFSQYFAPSQQ